MARGYPDFFGYSVFPGPGTGSSSAGGVVAVGGGATETLVELTLKGHVFGGFIYGDSLGTVGESALQITVDGVALDVIGLSTLLGLNMVQDQGFLMGLSCYDVEHDYFLVRLLEQLSFGYQYKLECLNTDVAAVNITTSLYYYNIV